jgi:diphthine-ammonia ligase
MTTKHQEKRAVISWTGGKDCALALYEAKEKGYAIVALVTFVPKEPHFLAHPLSLMSSQAQALGLPHVLLEITHPFKKSYKKALQSLQKQFGITAVITGDIAEVCGLPNWLTECSKSLGIDVVMPLWGRDRKQLVRKLIRNKFQVIFSGVKTPWFSSRWVGKRLDQEALDKLEKMHEATGLDICGENGEFHTQVLDGPLFKKTIRLDSYTTHVKETLMYLQVAELSLQNKAS